MPFTMDPAVTALLAEYEERAANESRLIDSLTPEEMGKRVHEFLISVGPATGSLLHMLATSLKAKCLVEIGVSYGYSTVWLADAARRNGGKLHSFEMSSKKVNFAREKLRSVGLDEYVEFHVGDALQLLPAVSGPIDFVLIDLWKELYCPCFELIHPRLASDGIVVGDNMLYPENTRPAAAAYQRLVREKGDMDSLLLPIGSGIEISRKRGADRSV